MLTVLVPRGVNGYASGTAQAVLDHALTDDELLGEAPAIVGRQSLSALAHAAATGQSAS